jgi:hypothetical protein
MEINRNYSLNRLNGKISKRNIDFNNKKNKDYSKTYRSNKNDDKINIDKINIDDIDYIDLEKKDMVVSKIRISRNFKEIFNDRKLMEYINDPFLNEYDNKLSYN